MSVIVLIFELVKIVCFLVILLLALVYSLLIILIPRFHCRSNILTLNLSLAFMCCCIYWLVYCLLWDYYKIELSSEQPCALHMYIQLACNCQLAFAFIVIPIHRYFSIVYHSKIFFRTKKWLILCLSGQWLMGLLVPLPMISAQNPKCIRPQWMSVYQLMVIIIIPSFISFVINAMIYIYVRSSFRRVRCSPQDQHLTIHGTSHVKISRRDIHLLRNMISTFCVFIGGWSPIFVLLAVTGKGEVAPLVLITLAVWAEYGARQQVEKRHRLLDETHLRSELVDIRKTQYFSCTSNKNRPLLFALKTAMDYLPLFLRAYDLDLQPSNSQCIDIEQARTLLYPGAHIATSNPYEHYHHGIVVDVTTPEISIIHLWGPDKTTGRVETTTLPVFLAGGQALLGKRTRRLYLINYEDDTLEKQQATVQMAKELLAKTDEIVYDIATLNCESFACFCRTGQWNSEQIERLKNVLMENALEIYDQVKNADEYNRRNIASVLQTVPTNALSPTERVLYDQLCEQYNREAHN